MYYYKREGFAKLPLQGKIPVIFFAIFRRIATMPNFTDIIFSRRNNVSDAYNVVSRTFSTNQIRLRIIKATANI